MKFLSNVLLIYLAVPVWLSGLANAQTINIYDEYKAGRRIIKEIITEFGKNFNRLRLWWLFYRSVSFSHYKKKAIPLLKYIKEKKTKES